MLLWGMGLSLAIADDVVVFGDSWAQGSGEDLGRVLDEHSTGLTVDNRGVGGTTAGFWATQPNALPDAVTENPDARWVWLSIGGNDIFAHHAAGEGANAGERVNTDIRIMLDALFSRHPDIRVVIFGYDFVNFEQSTDCITQAFLLFGPTTTPAVNQIFLDQIGAIQQAIADDYPNVTYVPLWGTLQAADGVPGAPNVLLPSPKNYFADCIHPTHEGYRIIHRALYDRYWGQPAPTAIIEGPAQVCVGDDVQWT
ncbi:MAG: SGNH/GDSL hydrolase family protein, partial [Myxococcota bacterium]